MAHERRRERRRPFLVGANLKEAVRCFKRVIDDLENSTGTTLRLTSLAAAVALTSFVTTSFLCAAAQPGNIGRDDRDDPITRELLHEQIPRAWTHQLQWKDRDS
jgi:hypothetical protein